MKEKIKKLIDVKSLTTLGFNFIFIVLCLKGQIQNETFVQLYMMILAFYFGTQVTKKTDNGKE